MNWSEECPFVVFVYDGTLTLCHIHTRLRRGVIIFFRSFDTRVWRYVEYEDESKDQAPRLLFLSNHYRLTLAELARHNIHAHARYRFTVSVRMR